MLLELSLEQELLPYPAKHPQQFPVGQGDLRRVPPNLSPTDWFWNSPPTIPFKTLSSKALLQLCI